MTILVRSVCRHVAPVPAKGELDMAGATHDPPWLVEPPAAGAPPDAVPPKEPVEPPLLDVPPEFGTPAVLVLPDDEESGFALKHRLVGRLRVCVIDSTRSRITQVQEPTGLMSLSGCIRSRRCARHI